VKVCAADPKGGFISEFIVKVISRGKLELSLIETEMMLAVTEHMRLIMVDWHVTELVWKRLGIYKLIE